MYQVKNWQNFSRRSPIGTCTIYLAIFPYGVIQKVSDISLSRLYGRFPLKESFLMIISFSLKDDYLEIREPMCAHGSSRGSCVSWVKTEIEQI